MSDWKELEIGNIPSDFRENDNYEVQILSSDGWTIAPTNKISILHFIVDNTGYKYRYRLKSLEPIKITNKILTSLIDDYFLHIPVNKTREEFICMLKKESNGEVIIID